MSVSDEKVLVVPTSLFQTLGYFQGFNKDVARYFPTLITAENMSFRPRVDAENDPSFKQLIPYMIFSYTNATDGKMFVFQYVRGKGMGEKRLHNKRSVGIGGHISLVDLAEGQTQGNDLYQRGMLRELEEEVDLRSPYTQQCVGLINDDETEVGRVHLGIVHHFRLERPDLTSRETDLIESGFLPIETLLDDLNGFETWSSISLKALFEAS
ncbi:MAG: phosphoesterase [Planctomycetaceae bacterium]|jgi:predicted NUDIX family phosphoesterase|nr:phosphoesterase [Planctomycetaceae bacterium]